MVAEAIGLVADGDRDRAGELYREAIRIDPHLPSAWLGLGLEFALKGDVSEAFRCYTRAITETESRLRRNPVDRASLVARSMANIAMYRPAEAVEFARRAIAIVPDRKLHSDIFFLMNFLEGTTPESHYAEVCRWYQLYGAPIAQPAPTFANVPDPARRLKVGYVSADLYDHAIMKFLPPILEYHDRSQFEVTLYSVGTKTDWCTEILRNLTDNFVVCGESGWALEERIRADGIDILVDLAGHTLPLEALLVFAHKPAPVQITWMGLLSSTGLPQMDYFLGDPDIPCPGTEHCFSETVYRLPRASACYRPTMDVPLSPSPCLQRGYVTFGSFNNPAKIGHNLVKVWARILHKVPRSRILLKYRGLDTDVLGDRYRGWFSKEGIARERVQFAGVSPVRDYLEAYGEIDVALDPFPYQGGSTTLDTLLMGVPIVSMTGRMPVQRCSCSLLKPIGLDEMVTDTPEQYVKAAVFLADVVGKIPDIRENVRKAFLKSPFRDERGITHDVEAAYRDMWRKWCLRRPVIGLPPA